jgi:hypothetical protein
MIYPNCIGGHHATRLQKNLNVANPILNPIVPIPIMPIPIMVGSDHGW